MPTPAVDALWTSEVALHSAGAEGRILAGHTTAGSSRVDKPSLHSAGIAVDIDPKENLSRRVTPSPGRWVPTMSPRHWPSATARAPGCGHGAGIGTSPIGCTSSSTKGLRPWTRISEPFPVAVRAPVRKQRM